MFVGFLACVCTHTHTNVSICSKWFKRLMQIILYWINDTVYTFHWNIETLPDIKLNLQSCSSHTHKNACRQVRKRARQFLLWPHSSVACSDADVLSTSLTSTNGSCPCAAVQPDTPLCLTRLQRWHQVNTYSHVWTHVHTHTVHASTQTRTSLQCLHTAGGGGSGPAVFLNRIHLCSHSEHHPAQCAGTYYMQSPCSRPEINR